MVMLSPGCCFCTCDVDFWGKLLGCMRGLKDVLVEFVDPDDAEEVFWAGYTDRGGVFAGTIADIPVPGRKFRARITLPEIGRDRFVDPSRGVAFYCRRLNYFANDTVGVRLVPADGYYCLFYFDGRTTGPTPVPGTATTDCDYPVPARLALTSEKDGAFDLVCDATTNSFGQNYWRGWKRVDAPDDYTVYDGNTESFWHPRTLRVGFIFGLLVLGIVGVPTTLTRFVTPDPLTGPLVDGFPPGLDGGTLAVIHSCLPLDASARLGMYPDAYTLTLTEAVPA